MGGVNPPLQKDKMPGKIEHIIENEIEKKRCGYCKTFLPLNNFCKNPQTSDGLESRCRKCNSDIRKLTRPQRLLSEKSWVSRNPEKVRAYKKKYRETHPETMKAIYNRRARKVLSTLDGKMNNLLRQVIKYSLRGNKQGKPWKELLPYSLEELKEHLESQFKEGMGWDNHSRYGWHIDHIKPITLFNITSHEDEEFKKCWALDNLQPLWWHENLKKQNKFELKGDL